MVLRQFILGLDQMVMDHHHSISRFITEYMYTQCTEEFEMGKYTFETEDSSKVR